MPSRPGAWVVTSALSLSLVVGCSLARDVAAGPNGGADVGPRDAPAGCLTSCDDHEPCTTDSCDSTGTCRHAANTAACDDHVLCNGGDTCGGGTCSAHDGVNPCPGTSHCDAATDACVGCTTASDCPAPTMGMWSECDFGADLCTTMGTQHRSNTMYTCVSSACVPSAVMEMQGCPRSTDGVTCAAMVNGDWTMCAFADPCTRAGTQSRVVTTSTCMGGTCQANDAPETQTCMRGTTDGATCGTAMPGDWSDCLVGSTCATSGTRTRTSTTYTCMSDVCITNTSAPEIQTCTVPGGPTGGACDVTTCDAWGACTQTMANTCSRTGTQTRMCHTPTCMGSGAGAACTGSTPSTQTQACSVDVTGLHVPCSNQYCGACRTTGGACQHGRMGTQTCNTYSGTCMSGLLGAYCGGGGAMQTTQSCNCP